MERHLALMVYQQNFGRTWMEEATSELVNIQVLAKKLEYFEKLL